jgi:hypothetical protein
MHASITRGGSMATRVFFARCALVYSAALRTHSASSKINNLFTFMFMIFEVEAS